MAKTEGVEVTLREILPEGAQQVATYLDEVQAETEFLIAEPLATEAIPVLAERIAESYASSNQILLGAFVEGQLVGLAEVRAAQHPGIAHIGSCSLSVRQAYSGFGIGQALLNELLIWAQETQVIRRLELTVQERNKVAMHIYRKVGFVAEATMARGARDQAGQFIDVQLMRMLIDPAE